MIGNVIAAVFGAAALVIAVMVALKLYRRRFSRAVRAAAEVVNKETYVTEVMGKERLPHTERRYVLSFMSGGRKLDFYVSAAMYESCSVGDRGNIEYKGDSLINFDQGSRSCL